MHPLKVTTSYPTAPSAHRPPPHTLKVKGQTIDLAQGVRNGADTSRSVIFFMLRISNCGRKGRSLFLYATATPASPNHGNYAQSDLSPKNLKKQSQKANTASHSGLGKINTRTRAFHSNAGWASFRKVPLRRSNDVTENYFLFSIPFLIKLICGKYEFLECHSNMKSSSWKAFFIITSWNNSQAISEDPFQGSYSNAERSRSMTYFGTEGLSVKQETMELDFFLDIVSGLCVLQMTHMLSLQA